MLPKLHPFLLRWRLFALAAPAAGVACGVRALLNHVLPNGVGLLDATSAGFAVYLSSSVFIISFMMGSLLADFKDAERQVSVVAISLEAMSDTLEFGAATKGVDATPHRAALLRLAVSIVGMLGGRLPEWTALDSLSPTALSMATALDHAGVSAPIVARLLAETHTLRSSLARIQTIADTSFVSEAYALADFVCLFSSAVLVFVGKYPSEAAGFVYIGFFVATFTYLAALLRALDNPMTYSPALVDAILFGDDDGGSRRRLQVGDRVKGGSDAPLLLRSPLGSPSSLYLGGSGGLGSATSASAVSLAALIHVLSRLRLGVHGSIDRVKVVEDAVVTRPTGAARGER